MTNQIRSCKFCAWLLLMFASFFSLIVYRYSSVNRIKINIPQPSPAIYPYIAMIIDDRATPALVTVVLNILQHIPIDWKVQIFTYPHVWPFYQQSSLAPFINTQRIFMTPIDLPRNNRSGADFINLYLTSPALWRRVQGEKVLYFQIDSAICSNSSFKLTDFLHYDYIGAPWKFGGCCNGGFSIRSRTKTLRLLESEHGRYSLSAGNEDIWYAHKLSRVGGIVAPVPVAKTFSVETIYYPQPFAVHQLRLDYLGKEDMKRICNECSEARTITPHCP